MNTKEVVRSALLGLATGDALGVPVEFENRDYLARHPITGMTGYGTHHQPPGTWSDDSSLTFCLTEALAIGFDPELIARYFTDWYDKSLWTPHGTVFDIGISTRKAIQNLKNGISPELSGGEDGNSNGNGSLMRIIPLIFHIRDKPVEVRFELTRQVSSVTHRHIRSVISCFCYLEFARLILQGIEKHEINFQIKKYIPDFLRDKNIPEAEISNFDRLLVQDISDLPERMIHSNGYVLHTLEAAIWCLLTTNTYKEAVLKAVNLGEDTDTTGAVTGGLAGLYYGFNNIPEEWIRMLARRNDIEDLIERFSSRLNNSV